MIVHIYSTSFCNLTISLGKLQLFISTNVKSAIFGKFLGKTMPLTIFQITIFIGGMLTNPKWMVYDIVLPTLNHIKIYSYVGGIITWQ